MLTLTNLLNLDMCIRSLVSSIKLPLVLILSLRNCKSMTDLLLYKLVLFGYIILSLVFNFSVMLNGHVFFARYGTQLDRRDFRVLGLLSIGGQIVVFWFMMSTS